MLDFEVERCSRHCATSGRALAEGETFYSVLQSSGGHLTRQDYSVEAWTGPPADAVAWWKSKIPFSDAKKPKLAPSEVLLKLFAELEQDPSQADKRYVLALLLVRRRLLKIEESAEHDPAETLHLYCPRDDATFVVPIVMPNEARVSEIQDELSRLLYTAAT